MRSEFQNSDVPDEFGAFCRIHPDEVTTLNTSEFSLTGGQSGDKYKPAQGC